MIWMEVNLVGIFGLRICGFEVGLDHLICEILNVLFVCRYNPTKVRLAGSTINGGPLDATEVVRESNGKLGLTYVSCFSPFYMLKFTESLPT